MGIIAFIILGALAGMIAKALMPGSGFPVLSSTR